MAAGVGGLGRPSTIVLINTTSTFSPLADGHPWPQSLKLSAGWESTLLVDDEGVLRALGTKGEPCHLREVLVGVGVGAGEREAVQVQADSQQRVCVCAVAAGCAHVVAIGRAHEICQFHVLANSLIRSHDLEVASLHANLARSNFFF